jgi:hypothetical protein
MHMARLLDTSRDKAANSAGRKNSSLHTFIHTYVHTCKKIQKKYTVIHKLTYIHIYIYIHTYIHMLMHDYIGAGYSLESLSISYIDSDHQFLNGDVTQIPTYGIAFQYTLYILYIHTYIYTYIHIVYTYIHYIFCSFALL